MNHHKNYVRSQARRERTFKIPAASGGSPLSSKPTDWESVDFVLDLDAALGRAGLGKVDSAICRMRLLDQLSFEDIAKEVDLSRMGAWKRFQSICKAISGFLSDYGCESQERNRLTRGLNMAA
jgi:DNA-directed RNA polymerase specialized sigma24 family protein